MNDTDKADKKARLAAALRENLRRRKAQARGTVAQGDSAQPESGPHPAQSPPDSE